MSESLLEQKYIGLLSVDLGSAMKRKKNARWLGLYWGKFDGKNFPEYSLAKAIALRDLFVNFITDKKAGIAYLVANEIEDEVLEYDSLVYVISRIWEWKLAVGAIEDHGVAFQAAIIFTCRKFQTGAHRALGHEFKEVKKKIDELPEGTVDSAVLKEAQEACTEEITALSEQLKGRLSNALIEDCPDALKTLLFPEIEDDAA